MSETSHSVGLTPIFVKRFFTHKVSETSHSVGLTPELKDDVTRLGCRKPRIQSDLHHITNKSISRIIFSKNKAD